MLDEASWRAAEGAYAAAAGSAVAARLLDATVGRAAKFDCFGRHEWAMLHQATPEQVRHSGSPLRVSRAAVDEVVETSLPRCTHYDAFRPYTAPARPLNVVQPSRDTTVELEQPGCLHATVDLYKWCYHAEPALPSELTLAGFNLARRVHQLDMAASPYDLSSVGLAAVPIETAAGHAEYVAQQRALAEHGQLRRARVVDALTVVPARLPA